MAYYYVKSGGTATGDTGRYASAKTSTDNWATAFSATTEYYPTIAAVALATTPPVNGDFVLISDTSSHATPTNVGLQNSMGDSDGVGVAIVCVDNDNVGVSAIATTALETSSNSGDYNFMNIDGQKFRASYYGMYVESDDNVLTTGDPGQELYLQDFTIKFEDLLYLSNDGAVVVMQDCDLLLNNSGSVFQVGGGGRWIMRGGKIECLSTIPANLFSNGDNGGFTVDWTGVDLSTFSGTLCSNLVDAASWKFTRCQLHASVTVIAATMYAIHRVELYNCSFGTAVGEEYQYLVGQAGCLVEDETSIYRDGSAAFPSTEKISLKCTTGTGHSKHVPFWFDCPTRYAELSSTASDVIRLYIMSSDTLNTDDVWVEAIYPDGTTAYVSNAVTTRPADILLDSTTPLDTNTEAWTGRTAENRYQIDIDTSGDPGADCVPTIRVYVAKASSTIYFCPTVELS